ncbi:MAG: hypothetical protein AB4041_15745 [Microcystaceae cyanobacterium]
MSLLRKQGGSRVIISTTPLSQIALFFGLEAIATQGTSIAST